jgi:hypothetical protein
MERQTVTKVESGPVVESEKQLTKEEIFASVTNKSRASKLAKAMFGRTARVYGTSIEADGEVVGEGRTFQEMFMNATRDVSIKELVELPGVLPELRAIVSADFRRPKLQVGGVKP